MTAILPTEGQPRTPGNLNRYAWIPVPLLLVVIAGLWVADPPAVFTSPSLVLLPNLLFTWLPTLCIGFLAARSFLGAGQSSLLMFGCGTLFWGVTSLAAALWFDATGNITITIHNLGVLGAALCHLGGMLWRRRLPRPGRWLAAGYAGMFLAVAFLVWAATAGVIPVFFVQGQGGTTIRQAVLLLTIILFAWVASHLFWGSRRDPASFCFWYGLGLALLAAGLAGVMLQSTHGSLLNWAGRITQYLGSVYLFIAAFMAARETGAWKISPAAMERVLQGFGFMEEYGRYSPSGVVYRYGLAMAIVAAALGLRLALENWVGNGLPPYITFYPFLMAGTLLAGFGPGVLATVLSSLAVGIWILPPIGQLSIAARTDRLGLAIYIAMGLGMSVFAELYRRNRHKAAAYDREEALRDARTRLAMFTATTREGVVESDTGIIVDCNEQLARMLGYSVDELKGMPIADCIAPEDRDRVMANIRQGREAALEHALVRKDGTTVTVETHGRPGPSGSIIRHTVVRDITERKQAESIIENTLPRYHNMLSSTYSGVLLMTEEGRVEFINQAFCDAFGLKEAPVDLVGLSSSELFEKTLPAYLHPEEAIVRIPEILRQGQPVKIEEFEMRGGRTAMADFVPLQIQGKSCGRFWVCTDITRYKQAEAALRASEQFNKAVLDTVGTLVVVLDTEGRIQRFNQACERATGFAAAEVMGRIFWNLFVPDDDKVGVFRVWARLQDGDFPNTHENHWLCKDGSRRLISWTNTAIVQDNQLLYIIGAGLDITERKRAEEALRESEALYRGIGESIDYGVWACAPDGRNTYASESFLKMAGITQEQCSNFGWGDLLHPDDAERTIAAWQECVRTGGKWDIEHRFRGADDKIHHVLARGVPVRNEQGDIRCWAGINLDISQLKEAEEQIKASLAEKEVLLREIHHRVKNNLQVISSLVSLQAASLTDERMRAAFDDVCDRVRAMALVHEKLYQTGNLAQLNFSDYASSLLRSLWRSHHTLAGKVRVDLALAPLVLPVVAAVPCGLILSELAGNALKHAFPDGRGGTVTVGLEHDSATEMVCLWVRDNGVGLPEGLDWRQSGSLGLRLVQILAGQLHGTVATSTGSGTEFRITFCLNGLQS